jgi:hypothetical protein
MLLPVILLSLHLTLCHLLVRLKSTTTWAVGENRLTCQPSSLPCWDKQQGLGVNLHQLLVLHYHSSQRNAIALHLYPLYVCTPPLAILPPFAITRTSFLCVHTPFCARQALWFTLAYLCSLLRQFVALLLLYNTHLLEHLPVLLPPTHFSETPLSVESSLLCFALLSSILFSLTILCINSQITERQPQQRTKFLEITSQQALWLIWKLHIRNRQAALY